jgi:hypothetical protein
LKPLGIKIHYPGKLADNLLVHDPKKIIWLVQNEKGNQPGLVF